MAQHFIVRAILRAVRAWLFLFYPLIWLMTRIEVRDAELARWMLHPAMLASEQPLLIAKKV